MSQPVKESFLALKYGIWVLILVMELQEITGIYRNNTVTTYVIHEVIIVMFVYYVHNSTRVLATHEHMNHDDLA